MSLVSFRMRPILGFRSAHAVHPLLTRTIFTPWHGCHPQISSMCAAANEPHARSDGETATTSTPTPPTSTAATASAKKTLRSTLRAALRALPPDTLREESHRITNHLIAQPHLTSAGRLGLYLSSPKLREVDTHILLHHLLSTPTSRRGTASPSVFLPRTTSPPTGQDPTMDLLRVDSLDDCVSTGPPLDLREPTPFLPDGTTPREEARAGPLDVLLMPGLGFDVRGGRLGRGGGYYDAYVESVVAQAAEKGWERPLFVGLALSCQVLPEGEEVPMADHDRCVDVLVVPERIILCSEKGRERWGGRAEES